MGIVRSIPCSRKKLLEVAKTTVTVIGKFLVQLTVKGINQQYLDDFSADLNTVVEMKTDKAIKDETSALNAMVKAKCRKSYKWGMMLKKYLKRAFGKKGVELAEFPVNFDEIKNDEEAMINTMPQVIELSKKYKSSLTTKGMSEDYDVKGQTLLDELDALNTEKSNKEKEDDAYLEQRHIAHLNLYDKINYVNDIGREVFENDPVNITFFKSPWTEKNSAPKEEEVVEKVEAGS